jgi:orotidine-5'-phosphate decarboxylase
MIRKNTNNIKDRIIVALDLDSEEKAFALVNQLRGKVGMFKIGSQLFTACGPSLVEKIINQGEKVFLDLKFHDIPNTVSSAAIEAARMGVSMLNLHAVGGLEMMQKTVADINQYCKNEAKKKPIILAVTILTSINQAMLDSLGFRVTITDQVIKLAQLAQQARCDGVVCSAHEVLLLRQNLGQDFILVTPGIRPSWSSTDDQKRINTPVEALAKGADYLVIGRPISKAENPIEAVTKIITEIKDSQRK